MKKGTIASILSLVCATALTLSLSACSSGETLGSASASTSSGASKPLTIGVIQYAQHTSLDNCTAGFLDGLKEAGYVEGETVLIDLQNAQGESTTADTLARNMVTSGYDLLVGVATPAAMSAYAAAKEQGIPVVFTAVSDPVAAGIVQSMEEPNTGATGTSDALNLEGQMKMIRAFLPEAKTIGILYTTSEPNSLSNLKRFQELAPDYGFEIVSQGITSANEVATGAANLVSHGVDCINNFTDNNVVNNLSVLLHAAEGANIPVFGSEIEQVKNGCIASESLDYVALGQKTGRMAGDILSGKADVNTLAVQVIADSTPVYSAANCAKFGLALPAAYKDAEDVDAGETQP